MKFISTQNNFKEYLGEITHTNDEEESAITTTTTTNGNSENGNTTNENQKNKTLAKIFGVFKKLGTFFRAFESLFNILYIIDILVFIYIFIFI